MVRSPARRSPRPRSPRPRSPRPRSPRPKSPRRKSPLRRPSSPRRRSSERGSSRRGPRSPPPRSSTGGNGVANSSGGGRRRKGKGRRRRRGPRGGPPPERGGGPPMSGGNTQPIASMRMRMDDYRPPRAERLLRDPTKDGDRAPIEQAVVRARREASTRTKDTFWTKKLLDAEVAQPNRWAHTGFKELYRDELGYSDIGEGSADEKDRENRAASRPSDPRDPSGMAARKASPPTRPRSPQDPRRRSRSRSPRSPRRSPRRSPLRPGQRPSPRSPRRSQRRSPKPLVRRKRTPGSRSPGRGRPRKRSYSSSYSRTSSSSSGSSYSRSYSSYSRSSSGSSSSSYTSSSSSSSGSRRGRTYPSAPRRPRSLSVSPRRGRVNRRPPLAVASQVRTKQVTHQETTKKLVTKTVSNVIVKPARSSATKLPKVKNKIKLKEEGVVRRKARSPPPPGGSGYYDETSMVVLEPTAEYRGPETPTPRGAPEGRHLLDPHHYKVVPPDHPDYHRPVALRDSPRSEGEDTDSDSSSDDDDGPRRMTLSERFGKLAQLSSQRQEYEGVRMKIVREGGQDKKVYLETGRLQSRSPSPSSRSRANHPAHERWLQEHQAEYREYQERYGDIRQWDPHRDLPRELPQNWDDVHVRYRYYKESGYFGDRSITLDDYLKWEEWWYRYRDWLEKYGGATEGEERDWQYRASSYEYEARGTGTTGTSGRWPRREASREADDSRKRRRF